MAASLAAATSLPLRLPSRRTGGPQTALAVARLPDPSLSFSLSLSLSLLGARSSTYRVDGVGPALSLLARTPRSSSVRCLAALTPELRSTLDKVMASHKVVLFMKGTRDFPQCGFSATVVQILNSLNVPFETLDVLENEVLRQALKDYSNWPTFPQLYIDGHFFGGCDITLEAYKSGELQEVLEKAMCS